MTAAGSEKAHEAMGKVGIAQETHVDFTAARALEAEVRKPTFAK